MQNSTALYVLLNILQYSWRPTLLINTVRWSECQFFNHYFIISENVFFANSLDINFLKQKEKLI